MTDPYSGMEIVKSGGVRAADGTSSPGAEAPPPRGLLARLAAWQGSTGERLSDKDPSLWRHRDVPA